MIQFENVKKQFGQNVLYEDLSFTVNEGDFVGITGSSGSGKSTLLNLASGIEPTSSGQISVVGQNLNKISKRKHSELLREDISFIFQNFGLMDDETVEENLYLAFAKLPSVKRNHEIRQQMEEALYHVGLQGFLDRKAYELSGGEQQRIAVARVLLKPSKIILCDEPTGSLDSENEKVIMNLLTEINQTGKTILLVTHNENVLSYCNRHFYLHEGQIYENEA